ncbi:MAG: type II secretion system protein [Verrucomicrobiota bacterium]
MKNPNSPLSGPKNSGFTLVEILVVLAIIGILTAILIPALGAAKRTAEAAKNVSNLGQISRATITWAGDNGNRLPSPEYPGGMEVPTGMQPEEFFPPFYDWGTTGLWLDGVVFAQVYLVEAARRQEEDGGDTYDTSGYGGGESGEHLKGTIFESTASVKNDPEAEDWHVHSYAMNANLQFDRRYRNAGEDAWLTEKTMANLTHSPNAMLYIDCSEENVVMFEDRDLIVQAITDRWGAGKQGIVAFADGHIDKLRPSEIPEEDPDTDRFSSRFWRGVDPNN